MQGTRRRLPPETRRQLIVEAAERLLPTMGDRVRVEDVVAEANAAKGTFFHYFPTWDDLLETIRARALARFGEWYGPPPADAPSFAWRTTLPELVAAFVEFTVAQRRLHEVLFHSDFARRRPLAPEAGAIGRLESLIRAGQAAGAYVPLDALLTAHFVFAVMHEAADLVVSGADYAHTLDAATELLRRALIRGEAA